MLVLNFSEIRLFTRNQKLGNGDFLGLRYIFKSMPEYQELIKSVQDWLECSNFKTVNLFGEFYGKRIQNRIDYGKYKQISFYDVYFDQNLQSASYFSEWLTNIRLVKLRVNF
jgi:hypothetical protein